MSTIRISAAIYSHPKSYSTIIMDYIERDRPFRPLRCQYQVTVYSSSVGTVVAEDPHFHELMTYMLDASIAVVIMQL